MNLPRQIYALVYEPTGKMYIGSSVNTKKRFQTHLSLLKHGKHPCKELQKDFDLHKKTPQMVILDRIDHFEDRDKEYQWMVKYKTFDKDHGYNYQDPKWPHLRKQQQ